MWSGKYDANLPVAPRASRGKMLVRRWPRRMFSASRWLLDSVCQRRHTPVSFTLHQCEGVHAAVRPRAADVEIIRHPDLGHAILYAGRRIKAAFGKCRRARAIDVEAPRAQRQSIHAIGQTSATYHRGVEHHPSECHAVATRERGEHGVGDGDGCFAVDIIRLRARGFGEGSQDKYGDERPCDAWQAVVKVNAGLR